MKNKRLSIRGLAIFLLISYIFLMLPIICLGKYDRQVADDYGYAVQTHFAWEQTHNINAVLQAVFHRVADSYHTWQGTFSSIFLMALNPAAFDYRLYKLVPGIMVFMLSLSCFALSKALVGKLLHNDNFHWLATGAALSILTVEKMYTIPSGLYWYNAAVHYTFMHALMILLLVCVLQLLLTKAIAGKVFLLLVSILFAVGAGGSNYATSLMGWVLLGSFSLLVVCFYRKKSLWVLPSFLCYTLAFGFNVMAPGNAVRQGNFEGLSAVSSILHSFKSAAVYSVKWMDLFTLLLLLLMVPVFWDSVQHTNFQFRLPFLLLLYSFCVVATGFTSSYYSMGTEGISRTHNVIKITYQILLFLNEAYFIGWVQRRTQKGTVKMPRFLTFLVIIVAMGCTVVFSSNQAGTFTSYGAAYYLRSGEAALFYNEYIQRKNLLETTSEEDVVLEPHQFKPWYLYIDDITVSPDDWRNGMVAAWYGKHSVRLRE